MLRNCGSSLGASATARSDVKLAQDLGRRIDANFLKELREVLGWQQ